MENDYPKVSMIEVSEEMIISFASGICPRCDQELLILDLNVGYAVCNSKKCNGGNNDQSVAIMIPTLTRMRLLEEREKQRRNDMASTLIRRSGIELQEMYNFDQSQTTAMYATLQYILDKIKD